VALAPLVAAAACWGFATVMTKAALGDVPPLTLLVIQLAVSLAFLWIVVLAQRARIPSGRSLLALGLLGLLNPGISYTLSLVGLRFTTASLSTLLWAAEPILILGLAWLILRERLTPILLMLSGLALVGVLLVIGIDFGAEAGNSLLGNALILGGVLCCALYTVLTRRTLAVFDPLALVAVQQTFALAWALAIWPLELGSIGLQSLAGIPASAWTWATLSGLVYYALAFWFYLIGLKVVLASQAGLAINLIPIFGVGGAYLFLGERLVAWQWAGAVLILIAVFGVLGWPRRESVPA
jgi:drug/metabolite transporter (DMT)-like permease